MVKYTFCGIGAFYYIFIVLPKLIFGVKTHYL